MRIGPAECLRVTAFRFVHNTLRNEIGNFECGPRLHDHHRLDVVRQGFEVAIQHRRVIDGRPPARAAGIKFFEDNDYDWELSAGIEFVSLFLDFLTSEPYISRKVKNVIFGESFHFI